MLKSKDMTTDQAEKTELYQTVAANEILTKLTEAQKNELLEKQKENEILKEKLEDTLLGADDLLEQIETLESEKKGLQAENKGLQERIKEVQIEKYILNVYYTLPAENPEKCILYYLLAGKEIIDRADISKFIKKFEVKNYKYSKIERLHPDGKDGKYKIAWLPSYKDLILKNHNDGKLKK